MAFIVDPVAGHWSEDSARVVVVRRPIGSDQPGWPAQDSTVVGLPTLVYSDRRRPAYQRRPGCSPRRRAMPTLTVNGEARTLPEGWTVAQLLERLGFDRKRVAVEVNRELVPSVRHDHHILAERDAVEIVTLVGGGATPPADRPLAIGPFAFQS